MLVPFIVMVSVVIMIATIVIAVAGFETSEIGKVLVQLDSEERILIKAMRDDLLDIDGHSNLRTVNCGAGGQR